MEKIIEIEVTEKEVLELFADRWCWKHWKRLYIPLWISLLAIVILAIFLRDASMWLLVPLMLLMVSPGVYSYIYQLRQSGKIAKVELEKLQNN